MSSAYHHRRSIRLRGWDYTSAAAYFVTVVTHERQALFGDVVDGQVLLSEAGRIAAEEWARTAEVRANVELDEFVVMPNHVHGIIWIVDEGREGAPWRGTGARHGFAPSTAAAPRPYGDVAPWPRLAGGPAPTDRSPGRGELRQRWVSCREGKQLESSLPRGGGLG